MVLGTSVLKAQEAKTGNNYYFKGSLSPNIIKDKVKLDLSDTSLPVGFVINYRHRVRVVDVVNGKVYFTYHIFKDSTKMEIYNFDSSEQKFVFEMSVTDFERLTSTYYNCFRGFRFGAFSVPLRIRSNDGDLEFDANLSLGTNLIGRVSLSRYTEHYYVDLSLGLGLTKVNLNNENSLAGVAGTAFENINILSPTAFTYSFGALFNLAEGVNIGAYIGWDIISSTDNKAEWVFNNKRWLGVGINIAFGGAAESGNKSGF